MSVTELAGSTKFDSRRRNAFYQRRGYGLLRVAVRCTNLVSSGIAKVASQRYSANAGRIKPIASAPPNKASANAAGTIRQLSHQSAGIPQSTVPG